MSQCSFDPLSTTASDLQQLLKEGTITSVQIVEQYRNHIEKYNDKLRAIICIPPNLTKTAQTLDDERKNGKLRGPLHGIPIIVKVRIQTQS
jgi:amidase